MYVFNFLQSFIVISIVLTVTFSELLKKLDKNDKLKGYRVFFPAFWSVVFTIALVVGKFILVNETPFYWAVIFGFSVFFYEAIVKHVKFTHEVNERVTKRKDDDNRGKVDNG